MDAASLSAVARSTARTLTHLITLQLRDDVQPNPREHLIEKLLVLGRVGNGVDAAHQTDYLEEGEENFRLRLE